MLSLSRLLDAPRAVGSPVAFGREGPRDVGAFRREVAALAARLAPAAGGRVLLHCEDAYAFAVGLFATGRVGACAVLPPSRQPGALRRLAPEVNAAVLDGDDTPETLQGRPCWRPLEATPDDPSPEARAAPLDREAPWVELFTSGTTGKGRSVAKTLRHLEDEVRVLEDRLGDALTPDTRVLATVSAQHLYGLLFRILWPLAAGRPFLRSSVLHPEELLPHGDAGDGTPFALVTTPASIRRLVEKPGLGALRGCRAIFASGGPLAAGLAQRAAAVLGVSPWEVFGSSESGGVAVRRQIRGHEPWQPLPGVVVERDPSEGCLAVTSPFVSVGEPRGRGSARCVLGDRVELDDRGGFRLLGRADRVIKVGEKRLSLPELEARLGRHPAVDECAAVSLEQAGETRVGAVVVPTEAGREILDAAGRRGLAKILTEHLAPDFDRVLLPRAWRVVAALPRNAQGKTPASSLRTLFTDAPASGREPEILSARREGSLFEARLRIPEKLEFLEGHFPSRPVVAGVVQVHFVMSALRELLGGAPRLRALNALKFREPLLPGQEVQLRLELSTQDTRFRFELTDADAVDRVFSSGRGELERSA